MSKKYQSGKLKGEASLHENAKNDNVVGNEKNVEGTTTSKSEKLYECIDAEGYLLPQESLKIEEDGGSSSVASDTTQKEKQEWLKKGSIRSVYQELSIYSKDASHEQHGRDSDTKAYFPLLHQKDEESIYDEVEAVIPAEGLCGAKFIPVEQPPSAYDEVIINGGKFTLQIFNTF